MARTIDKALVPIVTELLGHTGTRGDLDFAGPSPISMSDAAAHFAIEGAVADRIDVLESAAASNTIIKETWADLAAVTGTFAGQGAIVITTDTGTHTDPVVGGTVPNSGFFSWSASPAGWKRIADYPVLTVGPSFTFATSTTDSDPGAGKLRFDNATLASVTNIYVDNLDSRGGDITGWLDSFDDAGLTTGRGYVYISKASDPANFFIGLVTGSIVDGTGYRKITVTRKASGGSFTADAVLSMQFSQSATIAFATTTQAIAGTSTTDAMTPATTKSALDMIRGTVFSLPREEFEGVHVVGTLVQWNADGTIERISGTASYFRDVALTPAFLAARDAATTVNFYVDLVSGSTSTVPNVREYNAAGTAIAVATNMTLVGSRYELSKVLDLTCTKIRVAWGATGAAKLSRFYFTIAPQSPTDPQIPALTEARFKQTTALYGALNIGHFTTFATNSGSAGTYIGNQVFAPSGSQQVARVYNPPGFIGPTDYFTALVHISRGYIGNMLVTPNTGLSGGNGTAANELRYLGNNLAVITGLGAAAAGRAARYFEFRIDAIAVGPITAGDNTVTLLYFGKGSTLPADARLLADAQDRTAFVNPLATGGDGSLARPFTTVTEAQNAGANVIKLRVGTTPHRGALGFYGARRVRLLPYSHVSDTAPRAMLWALKALVGADFTAPEVTYPNLYYYAIGDTPGGVWERPTASYTLARFGQSVAKAPGANYNGPSSSLANAQAVAGRWFHGTGPAGVGLYLRPTGDDFTGLTYEIPDFHMKDAVQLFDCGDCAIEVDISGGRDSAVDALRSGVHFGMPIIGYSGRESAVHYNGCRVSGALTVIQGGNDGFSTDGLSAGRIDWLESSYNVSDGLSNHGADNRTTFGYVHLHHNGKYGLVDIGLGRTHVDAGSIHDSFLKSILLQPSSSYGALPTTFHFGFIDLNGGECQIDNSLGGSTLIGTVDGMHNGSIQVVAPAGADSGADALYTEVKILGHRGTDTATKELLEVTGGYVDTKDFKLCGGLVGAKLTGGTLKMRSGTILRGTTGITQTGGTLDLDATDQINVPTGVTGAPTTRTSGVGAPDIAKLASVAAV